jgi:signal transduction histidine kinase
MVQSKQGKLILNTMEQNKFINFKTWLSWFGNKSVFSEEEQSLFFEEMDKKNLVNFRFLNMAILLVILLFCFLDKYLLLDKATHYSINLVRIIFILGFALPFVVYSFSKKTQRISQALLIINALGYGIFLLLLSILAKNYPIAVAHNTVAFFLVNISLYLLFGLRQKYALALSFVFLLFVNFNYFQIVLVREVSCSAIDLNVWFIIVTIVGALSGKHIDNLLENSFRVNLDLKRVNESKYQLFSMVSHDLKNMISAQYTITDCLTEQSLQMKDNGKDRMIEILHHSAIDVLTVFEELMSWIKTQVHAINPTPKAIDIEIFNKTIANQMQAHSESKGINLVFNKSCKQTICTDANILGLILRNVIGNAIKYSKPNTLVHINTIMHKNFFEYQITDTGMGMSDDKLANLFNIHKVESNEGTKGERGTGLGLLLTKELLVYLNGEIKIASKLGKGTLVRIILPVNS